MTLSSYLIMFWRDGKCGSPLRRKGNRSPGVASLEGRPPSCDSFDFGCGTSRDRIRGQRTTHTTWLTS